MDREALIHFIGGAVGGTAGTAITCPLEVVKTRMQSTNAMADFTGGPSTSGGSMPSGGSKGSSHSSRGAPPGPGSSPYKHILAHLREPKTLPLVADFQRALRVPLPNILVRYAHSASTPRTSTRFGLGVFRYIQHVVRTEGVGALYKGLVPNLFGVAPSKAVYFYTYSTSKRFWNETDIFVPNSAIVHMVSAGTAGMFSATAVNPIWLVKTRLQLYHGKMGIFPMVRRVYQREGFRGFYRGVTASYAGVSETMIQFVLYEHFRQLLLEWHGSNGGDDERRKMDFLNFMLAGGTAKFVACVIAYPHEVVRTRLREENSARRGFFGTLYQLYGEGGRAMYRGLSVQLMRTVPSTAITMSTYEMVVYLLHQL